MRFRHKHKVILVSKTDMDAAYRCLHANLKSAATCIVIINGIAYILLRLPFGSSPAPSEFSIFKDILVDLFKTIMDDPTCDPDITKSPYYSLMEDLPIKTLSSSIPFGQADELFVPVADDDISLDGYIDDLISLGIDTDIIRNKLLHTVPLGLHCFISPIDCTDPLPCDPIVCKCKQDSEGLLEEIKICLGWEVDFRRFLVRLPKQKLTNWLIDINNAINNKKVTIDIWENMIGHLNNASYIIPFGKYLLSQLQFCLRCARERKYKHVILQSMEIEDLKLWQKLLINASSKGCNINHITFTHPTLVAFSDACDHGFGGFVLGGEGWRYELPPDLIRIFHINLLEFIAQVLTIEFALLHSKFQPTPHRILGFTDSSSALGWLFCSTFDPISQPLHNNIACELAWIGTKHNCSLFAQHIKGDAKIIADSLSRDFHLSNTQLTSIICSHIPLEDHSAFKIMTHPRDITLWL